LVLRKGIIEKEKWRHSQAEVSMDSTRLGELMSLLYARFLAQYGEEELASVATAAAINELLWEEKLCAELVQEGHEALAT
jgi:hypothetical protein